MSGPNVEDPRHHKNRIRKLILILLAIAGVLLATQHWTHLSPFIPYAIILACPLMHFFGHGRHRKHSPGE